MSKQERFELRLDVSVLESVDHWRAGQSDVPSRSEAVRRLIGIALIPPERRRIEISGGEKLLLMMFRDIYKHLKIDGEMDPEFVAEAIWGGHSWGLEWQYRGIFDTDETSKITVSEVVDILDMWDLIELGYARLSDEDKQRIATEELPFSKHVQFLGFDGNYESEYISVARFMIDRLERFLSFKGRNLNSHMPLVDAYRRMLSVFGPIRARLGDGRLSAKEVITLLTAAQHPSRLDPPTLHQTEADRPS